MHRMNNNNNNRKTHKIHIFQKDELNGCLSVCTDHQIKKKKITSNNFHFGKFTEIKKREKETENLYISN